MAELPFIRGSTKTIMLGLYANLMGFKGELTGPVLDVLEDSTKNDAKIAPIKEKLSSNNPGVLQRMLDSIPVMLSRIRQKADKKDYAEQQEIKFTEFKKNTGTLYTNYDALKKECELLIKEQTQAIRLWLTENAANKSAEQIKRELNAFKERQANLKTSADRYQSDYTRKAKDGAAMYHEIRTHVPDKTGLPALKQLSDDMRPSSDQTGPE